MIGLFFTGTDTGVGKTRVVCAVARLLRRQGREFAVCKPVATGAVESGGQWRSEDTIQLAQSAGLGVDHESQITPWVFRAPAAPPVAAAAEGKTLALPELIAAVQRCARPGVPVLVEGVGGLLCPLTDHNTVADLVAALALPLVVVTRCSLGTLNHTLLTLEVAHSRGLRIAGLVINETEPVRTLADTTNVRELRRRIGVPVLAVVPYQEGAAPEDVPALGGADWWGLCSPPPGRGAI